MAAIGCIVSYDAPEWGIKRGIDAERWTMVQADSPVCPLFRHAQRSAIDLEGLV